MLGGDLGDRGVQDRDVVGAGVGAGVAFAEHDHEQLTGVVAGREEGVVAVRALECPFRPGLVAVRDHDGGVQADHDGLAEVAVTRSRSGDLAVPGLDLAPHLGAGLGAGPVDPVHLDPADLVQAPPRRGRGRDGPEQVALVAQRLQVIDRGGAVGDRHGQVGQQPAPVDVRVEPAHGQCLRQGGGQPDLVPEQAQQRRSDVGDHALARHSYPQIAGPSRTL